MPHARFAAARRRPRSGGLAIIDAPPDAAPAETPAQTRARKRGERLAWATGGGEVALALLGILASVALKISVDAGGPLWLDEAWTGAIAGARPFSAFAHQAWLDPNPPVYFLLMHLWTGVAGLSAAALRAPSLAFALAAPLAAALVRTPGLSSFERLTWAAVVAMWGQAILYAQEARGYSLLILLALLQLIAFVRLVRRADPASAWLWAAASCAAILTHYHALILTGAQAALLAVALRRRLLPLWPAAFAFAPAAAWIAVHARRVAVFARPEVAWYPPMDPWLLEQALDVAADGWPVVAAVVASVVGGITVERALRRQPTRFSPGEGALWLAAVASLAGAVAVVALGFLRPSFTPRYLIVFGPGVLLGLVLACRNLSADGGRLGRIAVLLIVAGSAAHLAVREPHLGRRAYQFQTASDWLMGAGARKLSVIWDNPTDRALAPEESRALFGFFFDRAHRPVSVTDLGFDPNTNPNARLLAATRRGADALLWVYDVRVPGTAARRFAPTLAAADADDPDLECRAFAGGALGVWACVRRPGGVGGSPRRGAAPK